MAQLTIFRTKACKHNKEGFCFYQINKKVPFGTVGKCIGQNECKYKEA